jgi:hypothetical protein
MTVRRALQRHPVSSRLRNPLRASASIFVGRTLTRAGRRRETAAISSRRGGVASGDLCRRPACGIGGYHIDRSRLRCGGGTRARGGRDAMSLTRPLWIAPRAPSKAAITQSVAPESLARRSSYGLADDGAGR